MKNEVRPIDANALNLKIREYMSDYKGSPTRLAVCRAVLSMLGDEGQTPTLTDHFPDLTKMIPLTLEQLRGDCEKCAHYRVTWNGCTPDFECLLSDRCLNRDLWEWNGGQKEE